jgi:PBP1b-binding outer membrane lipoprotein LpoB
MKSHIMIVFVALVVSACASNRDIASTSYDKENYDRVQHAQMIDGAASRIH